VHGRPGPACGGQREAEATHLADEPREQAVLRLRRRIARHERQHAVLPAAVDEQALLRAVAEVALVPLEAGGRRSGQADLDQPVLDVARLWAGQRQVVGADRAAQPLHRVAAAVAAGLVLELQHRKVGDARALQRARRRQAGDARADDEHVAASLARARGGVRGRVASAVAHAMAARAVVADPAALDPRAPVVGPAAAGEDGRGGQRGAQEGAPRGLSHGPCPILPRTCAPASGSRGGSARSARAPCRAGNRAAPACRAGSGSAGPAARCAASPMAGGWR